MPVPHPDTDIAGIRMTTRVGQRLAHDPQRLNTLRSEGARWNPFAPSNSISQSTAISRAPR